MRHKLGIGVFLIAAFGGTLAKADLTDLTTYTMHFTGTGSLPTAGTFTYDLDTSTFTSFLVTWSFLTFDLTGSANAPAVGTAVPTCITGSPSAAASFAFLTGSCLQPPNGATTEWLAFGVGPTALFSFKTVQNSSDFYALDDLTIGSGSALARGGWTVTADPAAVPEPSSLIPALLLLCTFVGRKRIAQGIRRATRMNR